MVVSVCVCDREREIEKLVGVCEGCVERERVCVCVCLCERE